MKRQGLVQKSLPDIEIFFPTPSHHGLFIEMKKEDFKLRKDTGELYKSPHINEQLDTLIRLNSLGYFASFCCGFEHAKNLLDAYVECNTEKLEALKLI